MRVLVTGGAGFIGSHLVDRLVADGRRVLVIDNLATGRADRLPPGVTLEAVDLVAADLERLLKAWRPDAVYHLAAQTSVPASMADPLGDLEANVIATYRLVAAAHNAGVRRIVFTSSGGAIYGQARAPAREDGTTAPRSYYGVHKLAAEGHVALAGMEYAIARPSNIYGPRQGTGLEGAVIPAFLEQARKLAALTIEGDGRQTRDFLHVADAVDAIVRLAAVELPSGTWNVAAARTTSILKLAALVERTLGVRLQRRHVPARPGDVRHSSIDPGRLRGLGWAPRISLPDGVAALVGSQAERSDVV